MNVVFRVDGSYLIGSGHGNEMFSPSGCAQKVGLLCNICYERP